MYSDRIELSKNEFDDNFFLKDKGLVIVKFYKRTCPHCVAMHEEWDKLARTCGYSSIKAIDISNQGGLVKRIIEAHNLQIPTVPKMIVFYGGKPIGEYKGERKAENVCEALKGMKK